MFHVIFVVFFWNICLLFWEILPNESIICKINHIKKLGTILLSSIFYVNCNDAALPPESQLNLVPFGL